jgi:hypothetical protein
MLREHRELGPAIADGSVTGMRRLTGVREAYRKADLRLRLLLFGDAENVAGRLRGDEPREQAAGELRRMRKAFEEAVDEAEKSNLPDDLKERAIEAREKQAGSTPEQTS